ncbi:MAG TPA: DNA-binding transcriptional regulator [Verrucomicrobiae bacterium]|jgi:LacI family transcriptional regulator|nr:DNA-binding transcriptional regulator [Verrucomicrobiae bacterium]
MARTRQRRVLIALGWYDYRLHRGIAKFAQERRWYLSANFAREKVIPWGWKGDGVLAWLGAGDDLAEFVASLNMPTVDFSFRRPQLPFPHVLEDHAQAAQGVADHFLRRGFAHFAFYSDANNWSYEERGSAFCRIVQAAGKDCQWLKWHQSPAFCAGEKEWIQKRRWLASQLKKAPKPLAIFAANDDQAVDVLESCEAAGLIVPEEVALIGAENNLLAPDAMSTPISSVDTNLQLLGYSGAELLEKLMDGEKAPPEPLRIPPIGLVLRKSSDIFAVKHPAVARCLRFILNHAHEPIGVKDLVRVGNMSCRGLHKAFRENIDRTPGEEIRRVRVETAKKLLLETNHKVETLAGMCGYQSANSFCVSFKQTTGLSPTQYRRSLNRSS